MSDYKFSVSFPPSVNQWKSPFKGRMILTKRGREYRALIQKEIEALGLTGEMLTERLQLRIKLYMPDRRVRDIDNYLKSLLDGLTKCEFWRDDEQIDKLTVERCEVVKGGRVDIEVIKVNS